MFYRILMLAAALLFHHSAQGRPLNQPAVVLSPLTLCKTPDTACAPQTYRNNVWQGCKQEPGGCYLREFEMALHKGDEVQVVEADRSGAWIRVIAYWCTATCKETFSGWMPRRDLVYLSEFRKMPSWPGPPFFQIEAGDYAQQFKVRKDGSFTASNRRSSMFYYRDIVWARLRANPQQTQFLFIPVADQHCWSMNPEEETYGDEHWNCFASPFDRSQADAKAAVSGVP